MVDEETRARSQGLFKGLSPHAVWGCWMREGGAGDHRLRNAWPDPVFLAFNILWREACHWAIVQWQPDEDSRTFGKEMVYQGRNSVVHIPPPFLWGQESAFERLS